MSQTNKRKYSRKLLPTNPSIEDFPQERPRKNEIYSGLMGELLDIMVKRGDNIRARVYRRAQESILAIPDDIYEPADLAGKPGIGPIILEKLKTYDETGTLDILEKEKENPENILSDVYGVGPKKAKELVAKGITSIAQLRERQNEVLNDVQKVGLKYYEDIQEKIPRKEIDEYATVFQTAYDTINRQIEMKYEIVGSYRRGATASGDIDVIITAKDATAFSKWIDELLGTKIIIEVLSRGKSKCLVITRLKEGNLARRVDFLYTTPEEYPFAVLYFTGSKGFNATMRGFALTKGLSLNEHGLSKMVDKKKEEKLSLNIVDERGIFNYLGLVYKEPNERIDGRAVVSTSSKTEAVPVIENVGEPVVAQKTVEKNVPKSSAKEMNSSPKPPKKTRKNLPKGFPKSTKVFPKDPKEIESFCTDFLKQKGEEKSEDKKEQGPEMPKYSAEQNPVLQKETIGELPKYSGEPKPILQKETSKEVPKVPTTKKTRKSKTQKVSKEPIIIEPKTPKLQTQKVSKEPIIIEPKTPKLQTQKVSKEPIIIESKTPKLQTQKVSKEPIIIESKTPKLEEPEVIEIPGSPKSPKSSIEKQQLPIVIPKSSITKKPRKTKTEKVPKEPKVRTQKNKPSNSSPKDSPKESRLANIEIKTPEEPIAKIEYNKLDSAKDVSKEPKTKKPRKNTTKKLPKGSPKDPKIPENTKQKTPEGETSPKYSITQNLKSISRPGSTKSVEKQKATDIKVSQQPIETMPKELVETAKSHIQEFKNTGITILEKLSQEDLANLLLVANANYYNEKGGLMTDNEYDIVKEYMEKKYPTNAVIQQVGAPIARNKVELPYEMWSMDKIKPDSKALAGWVRKYPGPYVLSCKLDGVSGLYSTEGDIPKLFTRGDGKVGQDVSFLLPILKLPLEKGIVVRGEFIIPKKVFAEKYAKQFANPRNLVSGIVNSKKADEKTADLHFVTYEVIMPQLKPSLQLAKLKASGFEVVQNETRATLSNESLSETLVDWRTNYEYEIDGVIVTDDAIHPRISGNPEHAFAFKMVLSDQKAEVKVVDVLWSPSKDGFLKPRVRIEPVNLGGVTIEYATGYNAKFIEDNMIGIGAIVEIIRSGDVIPKILKVIVPAEKAKMPAESYKWNDTRVDVLLENAGENATVQEKNLTAFFSHLEVDGLKAGNIKKLMAAGYDTIPKILAMTKEDFAKLGYKTMADKYVENIREKVENASVVDLMVASGTMGRGLSNKKLEPILEAHPDILVSKDDPATKIAKVKAVKGIETKTATLFVENIPRFIEFLESIGQSAKLSGKVPGPEVAKSSAIEIDKSNPLYKKKIVMTKVRDQDIIRELKARGAGLGDNIDKNTFVLIVKSLEDSSNKTKYAVEHNILIMTPKDFKAKYLI
jgi:DNA ligase (NAD+)